MSGVEDLMSADCRTMIGQRVILIMRASMSETLVIQGDEDVSCFLSDATPNVLYLHAPTKKMA